MPDVLIRDVREETKAALAKRASQNGRSMQAEMRLILDDAARRNGSEPSGSARDSSRLELPGFEDPQVVAARIEKRKAIFKSMEERSRQFDLHNFPGAATLLAEVRAEKEEAEDALIAMLREGIA